MYNQAVQAQREAEAEAGQPVRSTEHLLGSLENDGFDANGLVDMGTASSPHESDVDEDGNPLHGMDHVANMMGAPGLSHAMREGLTNEDMQAAMRDSDLSRSRDSLEQTMEDTEKALDEFQDYEWEDDQDIDMGEADPWDDDAVMDNGEDEGLDNCPFGQMMNDDTGLCEAIEGGYTDEEFGFGDELTDDEFIKDQLSATEDDSDFSLSEIQEDFEESSGINPQHIQMAMGALFTIFVCIACPIIYMMRRQDAQRAAVKSAPRIKAAAQKVAAVDEDDDSLENTV